MRSLELMAYVRRRITDDELPAVTAHVYLALATYANDDGDAWPSVDTLAAVTRHAPSTVYRALADLEERELIRTRRRGPNRTALRHLLTSAQREVKTSAEGEVTAPDLRPARGQDLRPAGGNDLRLAGGRTPSRNGPVGTHPPNPPRGGKRERDRQRFDDELKAWAAHHFPGVEPGLVNFAASRARHRLRAEPTADDVRRDLEPYIAGEEAHA